MEVDIMTKIFCTTDTHGCAYELRKALEMANFDYEKDTLIHLGDCIDRGPDSKGVIDLLLSIKNLIAVRGNHDDWLREYIDGGSHGSNWNHGASKTFVSYLENNTIVIPQSHKDFFKNQVNYYVDNQNRLFVHAGYNRYHIMQEQIGYILFWDRDLTYKALDCKKKRLSDINNFKRVFIGHETTHRVNGSTVPIYAAQVVNLDTGVAYGGKLSLIDITDDSNHILYQV